MIKPYKQIKHNFGGDSQFISHNQIAWADSAGNFSIVNLDTGKTHTQEGDFVCARMAIDTVSELAIITSGHNTDIYDWKENKVILSIPIEDTYMHGECLPAQTSRTENLIAVPISEAEILLLESSPHKVHKKKILNVPSYVTSMDFSSDNRFLATANDSHVDIWEINSGKRIKRLENDTAESYYHLCFEHTCSTLYSLSFYEEPESPIYATGFLLKNQMEKEQTEILSKNCFRYAIHPSEKWLLTIQYASFESPFYKCWVGLDFKGNNIFKSSEEENFIIPSNRYSNLHWSKDGKYLLLSCFNYSLVYSYNGLSATS